MTLNGIDISNWQPDIDLSKVTADFVIIKATQGIDYVSPNCNAQYTGAKNAGKLRGLYHYADGSGAEKEAQYFLDNIKNYIGEAVLALDWEGDVLTKGVSYAKAFLDYVYNQTGIRPVIYMSKSVTNTYDWSSVAKDYALWCAQYANDNSTGYQSDPWSDDNPFGSWTTPSIYQYSSHGALAGYDGRLDLDLFYGDADSWAKLAKSDKQSIPEPDPEPEPSKKTPIVQYADDKGNRAYAYTHWKAIADKPDIVTSDILQDYAKKSELPTKVQLKTGTITVTSGLPTIQYAYNDKLVTLTFFGSIAKTVPSMQGDTQVGTLATDIPKPPFSVTASLVDISSKSNMGHLKVQTDGQLVINMTDVWNGDWISGTVSYAI